MDKKERLKIQKRLEWLDKEILYRKNQINDCVLHHHYMGYLEAADGMFGERRFLMSLLNSDNEREVEKHDLRTDSTKTKTSV